MEQGRPRHTAMVSVLMRAARGAIHEGGSRVPPHVCRTRCWEPSAAVLNKPKSGPQPRRGRGCFRTQGQACSAVRIPICGPKSIHSGPAALHNN